VVAEEFWFMLSFVSSHFTSPRARPADQTLADRGGERRDRRGARTEARMLEVRAATDLAHLWRDTGSSNDLRSCWSQSSLQLRPIADGRQNRLDQCGYSRGSGGEVRGIEPLTPGLGSRSSRYLRRAGVRETCI
jgi:hypothetical protein